MVLFCATLRLLQAEHTLGSIRNYQRKAKPTHLVADVGRWLEPLGGFATDQLWAEGSLGTDNLQARQGGVEKTVPLPTAGDPGLRS